MGAKGKSLLDQALELTPKQRAAVAERLLESLDRPDPEMDAIWAKESERRIDAYDNGEMEVRSLKEVFGPQGS